MQVSVAQADIEQVWRPLTAAEAAVIPGLSNRAWLRIVGAVPGIESFLDASLPASDPLVTPEAVQDVMASMIVRVLKNPESARIISESIDDYTSGRTLDDAVASGEMYVSAFEVSMLTPAPVVPVNGMYVLGLGG
jgi:hypothetical protein